MDFQFYKYKITGNLLSIITRSKTNDTIKYHIINISMKNEFVNHNEQNKICIFMKSSPMAIPRFYDITWKETSEKTIKQIEGIEGYKPSDGIHNLIGINLYSFVFSLLLIDFMKD
jgi:hypothetical protein